MKSSYENYLQKLLDMEINPYCNIFSSINGRTKPFPTKVMVNGWPVLMKCDSLPFNTLLLKATSDLLEQTRDALAVVKASQSYASILKSCLKNIDRPFDKEYFNFSLLCLAPAKCVQTLVEGGADVNAAYTHPVYSSGTAGFKASYPALVFAAYDADADKVKALFAAGAYKNNGYVQIAAQECVDANHVCAQDKCSCLWEMEQAGASLNWSSLAERAIEPELKNWLEDAAEVQTAQIVSRHQAQKLPNQAHTRA